MNIFPIFYPPKLCKILTATYFVFVFHVVTLAILLKPAYLPVVFQISNCNVVMFFRYLL